MAETKEQRALALESLSTLCDFFQYQVRQSPDAEALREFSKAANAWISYTYAEVAKKIRRWQCAFVKEGFKRGSRVAMLLPNGVDAVCFDQAALANGLIPVPLHAIDTPASSAFILNNSETCFLVTNKSSKWQKIKDAGFDLSSIKRVVFTDDDSKDSDGKTASVEEWLDSAPKNCDLPEKPGEGDLACIVYTSGTTGRPKGVMLTHKNIVSNVRSTLAHVNPEPGWTFLSFLPLSHMFERTAGYYLALATGCTIVFNRSLQYLAEDFKIAKPDVLISVPRVYERIYGKLQEGLRKSSATKRAMFNWGVEVGWRNFCRKNKISTEGSLLQILDSTIGKAVSDKISNLLKDRFGGRLKVAISGGATLNHDAAKVFCGLGLPVIQGYGMTETSPIIAGNNVVDNDPATVGRLLRDVDVRLGEKDEILVKGDLVMKGYWNLPDATKKAFTEDGWLHTGDQGAFDKQGRLKIVGRIKEIIVTSTGEKISPVDIESAVEADSLVAQCYAVGEDRPYISVILSLELDAWKGLAKEIGLDPDSPDSLLSHAARQKVLARVRRACRMFPAYAVPRNVYLTLEPWSIENGLLTPTLKLKRIPLLAKYGDVIEGIYKGARC